MRFARFSFVLVPFVSLVAVAACTASVTSSPTDPAASGTDGGAGKDGGGGGAASDGASGGGGSACERACAKSAGANCSAQASCVSDCEADLAKIPASCKDQADAAIECAGTKATAWKCDDKGKAVVTAGCDDETGALISCIVGGGQDAGGDGGSCGTLTSGKAACDTCVNNNCCAQAAACSSDAECGAILQCFSSCNDDACYTKCENAHPSGVSHEQAFYTCLGTSCKAACQ